MVPTHLSIRVDQYYRELLDEAAHERLLAQTQHAALSVALSHIRQVAPVRQFRHLARDVRVLLSSLATVAFSAHHQS